MAVWRSPRLGLRIWYVLTGAWVWLLLGWHVFHLPADANWPIAAVLGLWLWVQAALAEDRHTQRAAPPERS